MSCAQKDRATQFLETLFAHPEIRHLRKRMLPDKLVLGRKNSWGGQGWTIDLQMGRKEQKQLHVSALSGLNRWSKMLRACCLLNSFFSMPCDESVQQPSPS